MHQAGIVYVALDGIGTLSQQNVGTFCFKRLDRKPGVNKSSECEAR
jgi:hypothetical protein